MKRLLIGFLIVILSLAMFVSCESDDDDDYGIVQPDNALFELVISASSERDDNVELYILESENPAESCSLLVDGEAITLTKDNSGMIWRASCPFEAGESYNLDLTINEGDFHGNADVSIPLHPEVNYPEIWDGQDDIEITWSLDENSTSQTIQTMGPDEYAFTINDLEPEDRSYVIPAGLHGFEGETQQLFTIRIEENNMETHDRIIFSAKSLTVIKYDVDEMIVNPPTAGWAYAMVVGCNGNYGYINVYASDGNDIIDTCTLLINGVEVSLNYYTDDNEWWGDYPLEDGVSYNFDLTINDSLHQTTDLAMPFSPLIDSPDTWDGQTAYELTWDLEESSKSQSLFIYGPDDGYRSVGSLYILTSLRSYRFQPNLHGYTGEPGEYLNFSVDQENWEFIDGWLFVSFTYDYEDFGSYGQTEPPRDHARRVLNDLLHKIK